MLPLTVLLLAQCRMPLVLITAGPLQAQSAHCPPGPPRALPAELLSSQALPTCITAKETSFPGRTLSTGPSWSASLCDQLEREVVKNCSQIKSDVYIDISILLHYFSLIMKRRVSLKVFLIIHNAKHKYRKSKGHVLCLFSFPEQLSIYVCFPLELKEVLLIFTSIAIYFQLSWIVLFLSVTCQ